MPVVKRPNNNTNREQITTNREEITENVNKTTKTVTKHDQFVNYAARWLLSRTNIVITEMAGIGEEADAIGFKNPYETILIECKASRTDFKADAKKWFRRYPERGMGLIRYYLAPKGMIHPTEIPEGWGLLEVINEKGRIRKKKTGARFPKRDIHKEMQLLISAIRRISFKAIKGISAKVYTYESLNKCRIYIHRCRGEGETIADKKRLAEPAEIPQARN